MKNLQNYGVQEMNAKEMENINGGGWFGKLLLAILTVVVLVGAINSNT
jgi:bacteriocin-like protein